MADTPGEEPRTGGQEGSGGQEPNDDKTFDAEYVRELRQENAKWRTQLRDVQAQLDQFGDYDDLKQQAAKWQEFEDKQKSDMEKLQDQLSQLQTERDVAQQRAQDAIIKSAFVSEASKAGFANPEDTYRLADLGKITINEDGIVEGVADAVKALDGRLPMAKTKAPNLDGGAGGKGKQTSKTEAELREEAVRLGVDPKFYAEKFGVKLE